jgi:hypothetical protein
MGAHRDGYPETRTVPRVHPRGVPTRLVIGPVESVTNGYRHYVLLPDGSKEGWADSDTGDDIRERFIGLFSVRHDDGSSPQEGVHVTYGGDYEVEVGVSVDYLSGGEVDLSARASHNDQAHA